MPGITPAAFADSRRLFLARAWLAIAALLRAWRISVNALAPQKRHGFRTVRNGV